MPAAPLPVASLLSPSTLPASTAWASGLRSGIHSAAGGVTLDPASTVVITQIQGVSGPALILAADSPLNTAPLSSGRRLAAAAAAASLDAPALRGGGRQAQASSQPPLGVGTFVWATLSVPASQALSATAGISAGSSTLQAGSCTGWSALASGSSCTAYLIRFDVVGSGSAAAAGSSSMSVTAGLIVGIFFGGVGAILLLVGAVVAVRVFVRPPSSRARGGAPGGRDEAYFVDAVSMPPAATRIAGGASMANLGKAGYGPRQVDLQRQPSSRVRAAAAEPPWVNAVQGPEPVLPQAIVLPGGAARERLQRRASQRAQIEAEAAAFDEAGAPPGMGDPARGRDNRQVLLSKTGESYRAPSTAHTHAALSSSKSSRGDALMLSGPSASRRSNSVSASGEPAPRVSRSASSRGDKLLSSGGGSRPSSRSLARQSSSRSPRAEAVDEGEPSGEPPRRSASGRLLVRSPSGLSAKGQALLGR